jgi:hypothetical protein
MKWRMQLGPMALILRSATRNYTWAEERIFSLFLCEFDSSVGRRNTFPSKGTARHFCLDHIPLTLPDLLFSTVPPEGNGLKLLLLDFYFAGVSLFLLCIICTGGS